LTNAFAELGRQFKRDTGVEVLFTFGSTGLLARQLRERAPFDMFAAASASFVDDVVRQGVCDGRTRALYGRGRLALWQRPGSAKGTALEGLRAPAFKRIALANPEHAPYGTAAREALITAGLWTELEPRLVYGENVRQTLQLAESGNVEAALVALSLVIDDRAGTWQLVDEQLHQPIDQELVACSAGNNRAGGRRFAAYVSSAGGRASMKRFGFLLPGESLVSAQ
jgi:molybdate transport system substrate-binding protein